VRIADPLDLVLLALFVLLGAGLVLQVRSAWRTRLMDRRAKDRRPRDVSSEARPPGPATAELIGRLDGLGFRRLGETELTIPEMGLTVTSWVRLDAEETTTAEVVDVGGPPMAVLISAFGDEAQVDTGYPFGERIRDPDLVCERVSSSIEEAYALHRREIDDFGAAHGRALPVADMVDFLRHEVAGRQRYSQRKLGKAWRRTQLGAVVRLAVVLAVVGYLLVVNVR
jgi:hypothetical protein